MTIAKIRSAARRYGRADTTGATDAQVNDLIQTAVTDFADDVGGFSMEVYPVVAAKFDTATNYAVRVTVVGGAGALVATDVLITDTARSGGTGADVAADLQTTLRAAVGTNMTVTYADFAFTVDTLDATSITYAEPSSVNYVDARTLLGLTGTPDLTDYAHTGVFPTDCTMEYTLPADMISVQRVEWNGNGLEEATRETAMSPEAQGVPHWYHIRGREIHFIPAPTTQGKVKIWYRGAPADIVFAGYQEAGLTGVSDESNTGLTAQLWNYAVAINGSDATEYDVTTTAADTYAALITLMNAQNTGATWSIVGGDLRCTSDAVDGVSSIAVTAGSTADILAALSITMETAVAGDTAPPSEIPTMHHKALPFLVAYYLLLEQFDEEKLGAQRYGQYAKTMRQFRLSRLSRRSMADTGTGRPAGYTVEM